VAQAAVQAQLAEIQHARRVGLDLPRGDQDADSNLSTMSLSAGPRAPRQ
jgi:hypothetical protein